VTGCGLDDQVSISGRRDLSLRRHVITGCLAHPVSPGLEFENDLPLVSTAEVKNVWGFVTSASQFSFFSYMLKNRGYFNFTYFANLN
jgi:hypothetical protein